MLRKFGMRSKDTDRGTQDFREGRGHCPNTVASEATGGQGVVGHTLTPNSRSQGCQRASSTPANECESQAQMHLLSAV